MSESEPHEGYRISRTLESIDREIRRQIRRHARGEDFSPSEPGTDRTSWREGLRSNEDRSARARQFENAPISTHARLLLSDGVSLPSPEKLGNGEEIQAKLWEVINALAARRVYIQHTNHLTDRELYCALWTGRLNEVTRDLSECVGCACYIDLLHCRMGDGEDGGGPYQIEPARRASWLRDRIAGILPDRRKRPYDRDQYLPKQGPW